MSNKIAITGSSGFVGSVMKKILTIPDSLCFDIQKGDDITLGSVTDTIIQRADTIIHMGAISGVAKCDKSPDEAHSINVEATLDLAKKLKSRDGIKRLIFFSSSAVYGEAQDFIMDESHVTAPRTAYGRMKLEAESILGMASLDYPIIILRPSNIYGYGMTYKEGTVLSSFISAYLENRPMTITGSGSQKRDFVHVIDVARIVARLATAPTIRPGIYNLGGNETLSMRALAEIVNDVGDSTLGYRVPVEYKPDANESLYHDFRYSSDKAKQHFQYEPRINLRYAITERMLMHLRRVDR